MSSMKIVAITNQKGGVGKTTTAINLATTLVAVGRRVLILDLDAQGNASTGLGFLPKQRGRTTYDLFMDHASVDQIAVGVDKVDGLFIVPSTTDLSSIDVELVGDSQRALKLREAFERSRPDFDYVIIDCPPSLNLLTVNALAAADSVLVPLQSEYFALEGLSQLMGTIKEIRASVNRRLAIQGVVLTMYDRRNNLAAQVEEDVRENLGDLVYETIIPRNVRLSEAPSFALPAMLYDPKSPGAIAYQKLAVEFLKREGDPIIEEVA